jgi:catechol 2,3-dioxygenase-like lactoylglutathione lyase family enzyme
LPISPCPAVVTAGGGHGSINGGGTNGEHSTLRPRRQAFFVGLGFEVEGRMFMEGEFVDTVIGIPDSRSEILTLVPPDGGTRLELSSFIRPNHEPGSPNAMSTELGLRNVAFVVDDLQAEVDRLAAGGYGLVGGIGQYEDIWRMAYVRGPEGIIVALAQRID